jgi:hypothetical protein
MIFVQNRSLKRPWSKIGRYDVNHGHPAKIPITQPLSFQALRTLLGQAPSITTLSTRDDRSSLRRTRSMRNNLSR